LSIPIFFLALYGLFNKKKWVKSILNKRIIIYSVLSFLAPMVPFIIYDISHGYKQTFGFAAWVLYRIIKFPLNILSIDKSTIYPIYSFADISSYLEQLIFAPSLLISLLIFIVSSIYLFYLMFRICRRFWTSQNDDEVDSTGYVLLFLYTVIPISGLFMHRVPIEADILVISPFLIMTFAVLIGKLISIRLLAKATIIILLFVGFANVTYIFSTKGGITITEQIEASDKIIQLVKGRNYNLVGQGELSFFPVFTMPYEYLLWWKGQPPVKEKVDLKIVVWEKDGEIIVYKENIKNQK